MTDRLPDPGAFGAAFEDFMRAMTEAATRAEGAFGSSLREHLATDPGALPSTTFEFASTDHANLQLALDAVLPDAEVLGYSMRYAQFASVGIAEVISGQSATGPLAPGPVQYVDVEVGDGRVVHCVAAALYLARRGDAALAFVLSRAESPFGARTVRIEGISPQPDAMSALIGEVRAAIREHNVYRGKVISLHQEHDNSASVVFHRLPAVPREGVILPEGTLERLERQAIGVAREAERLRRAGRHLKRGVLLHGPPGTGKTLCVTYLVGAMPGRTTILLTGRGLGLIEQAFAMARDLAPATVVFEDIDLVAAERTMPYGDTSILFELLNQIEGLEEDGDLLFLLTTNRPDIVEPALAARPGRIDLALETPMPGEEARRRLVRLYAEGIPVDEAAEADVVARTEGVSGAFIRELMRQAALGAALEGRQQADAADVRAALDELLADRSALTRRLLGEPGDGAAGDTPSPPPLDAMVRAFGAAGLPIPPDFDM